MQATRVLLVVQPTTGGTARCVEQLVSAGVAAGIDVTVACPASPLATAVVGAGARWIPLALTRAPAVRDVQLIRQLRSHFEEADVVHLHSSKAGALGRLALGTMRRARPGCIFTPHGWSWQSGGPLTPAYRTFERRVAHLADAIVAVSAEERDAGHEVIGKRANIVVIENGVNTSRYAPEGPRAERGSEPLVVCVGRLAHPKGQDVTIRALAEMRNADARLRLLGDGPDRASLEALAATLEVSHRIELVGHVPDPAPHLRAADVVVVPSYSEGQSLAMLEGMACGRPIVTTAVAGSSAAADAGAVVPIGDASAMARSLDALLEDDERRAELGATARRLAEVRFDEALTTERNIGLWRELAASTRPC